MSNKKPFFKRTPVKIALLTLFFLLMILIGAIPVWIVFNMAQTLFIRIIIGLSGPIWAIVTITIVASRSEYSKLWHKWRHEREAKQMSQARSLYPEYQRLYQLYPRSIQRYEQHWRHHRKDKNAQTLEELIESALEISEEEWAKREEFRRQAREERKKNTSTGPGSLAPSRN